MNTDEDSIRRLTCKRSAWDFHDIAQLQRLGEWTSVPLFDTTLIHARTAAERAMAG